MKIAVFTSQFPGKLSTFFVRDIKSLIDNGFEVEVFSLRPVLESLWKYVDDDLDAKTFPRDKVYYLPPLKIIKAIFKFNYIKGFKLFPELFNMTTSSLRYGLAPFFKTIYSIIQGFAFAAVIKTKYDHVLAYWGNFPASTAMIFHALANEGSPFSTYLHARQDLYRHAIYLPQKMLYADNLILVCDFNRQFIHKKYPDTYKQIENKIHIHILGLDLEEFPFSRDNRQKNMVLAVGRLVETKGFDYLLNAIKKLREQGIDVCTELVGDGPEEINLKNLARQLGITDYVKFHGVKPFNEVKKIMSQATLLVLPCPVIGDAMPTVLKEAMALGTPVAGTGIAAIPELLGHGKYGILFEKKSINSLADTIKQVITNPEIQEKYALAGRKQIEEIADNKNNGVELAELLKNSRRIK